MANYGLSKVRGYLNFALIPTRIYNRWLMKKEEEEDVVGGGRKKGWSIIQIVCFVIIINFVYIIKEIILYS